MGSESKSLHILFFPIMAAGHMIPMVDMARLFASHGVKTTILTTPANVPLLQPSITHANLSNPHPISLALIPFPSIAAGLPEGCENISTIAQNLKPNFLKAVAMLRQPFDQLLTDLHPDCIVTDMFLPWTVDVASAHNIKRLVFHGIGFFSLCARTTLDLHQTLENLPADADSILIPGLPHKIEMLRSQMPEPHRQGPSFRELFQLMKESESKSYGVVVNSFYELEPDYAKHYREVIGRRAWHIGPVSLCNQNETDQSARGNEAAVEKTQSCLEWLNRQKPDSVVYICFGSMGEFTAPQVRELALGLEATDVPFIWVVRKAAEEWMPEGFEERIGEKGVIIRGWAPQILILNHIAVGGFVTHCGWNSTLEGVSAGVPMVTWPMFAEQFYNERLVVEILGIGVSLGVREYTLRAEDRPVVEAGVIEGAVRRLMGGGDEGEGRRKKARELGEVAKRAVEVGGSSFVDLENLVKELMGDVVKRTSGGGDF